MWDRKDMLQTGHFQSSPATSVCQVWSVVLCTVNTQTNSYPHFIVTEATAQGHTARNWQRRVRLWCVVLWSPCCFHNLRAAAQRSRFPPLCRIHWVQSSKGKPIASTWQEQIELVRCGPEQRSNSESLSFIPATWDHSHVPPVAGAWWRSMHFSTRTDVLPETYCKTSI